MPSTRSSLRNATSPPASGLKYTGANNLGLGFPDDECYFMIWEDRDLRDWSVFEALARLDEFSKRERAAILRTCEIHAMLQARYGKS